MPQGKQQVSFDVDGDNEDSWATSAEIRQAKKPSRASKKKSPKPLSTKSQGIFKTQPSGAKRSSGLAITHPTLRSSSPSTSPDPMPPANPPHLLICSLGNPGSTYANTLHSAGHTVLARLAEHLRFPPFEKERPLGNGCVSRAPATPSDPAAARWTLWQSPSYMNESGKPVRAAFTSFRRGVGEGEEARLVVVHDELERGLGEVSVKDKAGGSTRGHNGLKSLLQHMGGEGFVRVGVGIGRPASRESRDVSDYVLRRMGKGERETVEGCVGEVVRRLREVK